MTTLPFPKDHRVAAVILAAGAGSRMGGRTKLTAEIGGVSLVGHVAQAALASRAGRVVVVTGHQAEAVETTLTGLAVEVVRNADHAAGLATSLRAGIAALDPPVDAALILLADMPFVTAATMDAMIAAFEGGGRHEVVVPVHAGRRGHPVLWPRRHFAALMSVAGDKGARDILAAKPGVVTVPAGPEILLDLDTPEALHRAGGRFPD